MFRNDGFFELCDSVIKEVSVTEDGIVLQCRCSNSDYISVIFNHAQADMDVSQMAGRTISHIEVEKSGYAVHFTGGGAPVLIHARSYKLNWQS